MSLSKAKLSRPAADSISVAEIEALVETFYGQVQDDVLLAPIFATRVENWETHLGRMVDFWRAVLRAEPTFAHSQKGSPPVIHRGIAPLRREHFDRWLTLFADTAKDIFEGEALRYVVYRSQGMARALSRHLAEPWQ